jgi:dUTP pyrophosphatase
MEESSQNSNENKQIFFCHECKKELTSKIGLISHMRIHKQKVDDQSIQKSYDIKDNEKHVVLEVSKPIIKIKRLNHGMNIPEIQRATPGSAAFDLYAAINNSICIGAKEHSIIPSGLCFEIPYGYVGKVVSRSGMAAKHRIIVTNSPGIIDSDYRGEVMTNLINLSTSKYWVNPGDRVAQILFEKVEDVDIEYVEELSDTYRGNGGFGSTGT